MPNYRMQCITRTVDGLAANYATNTLYVTADDEAGAAAAADAIAAEYVDFSVVQPNSIVLATLGLVIKCYDMADPEPREQKFESGHNLFPSGGDPLPTEVAICLSYQAPFESGIPQSRRRGRIYLPFLMEGNNDANGRPNTGLTNAVAAFGSGLSAASAASADWLWVQHSVVDNSYIGVSSGFVDNEWDTQRRRGRRRTARFSWS